MNTPPLMNVMKELTKEMGATILTYPKYEDPGIITFKNGEKFFFSSIGFCINTAGATNISKNKEYSSYFLKYFGYNTPEEDSFFSDEFCTRYGYNKNIEDGYIFSKKIGFPVMLKPNNLSKGQLIAKVHNKKEYYLAAKRIFLKSPIMIIQKFCTGNDYRVTVLNNKVVAAYQRIPLFIIGDGKSTISQLIELKQKAFYKSNRTVIIDTNDYRMKQKLKSQNLNFNSIIADKEKIFLLDIANASAGGDVVDYTDQIHKDYRNLAINITNDLGLILCGVDILTNDITKPIKKDNYVVIETNAAPGLGNFASIGEKQYNQFKEVYRNILHLIENGKI